MKHSVLVAQLNKRSQLANERAALLEMQLSMLTARTHQVRESLDLIQRNCDHDYDNEALRTCMICGYHPIDYSSH